MMYNILISFALTCVIFVGLKALLVYIYQRLLKQLLINNINNLIFMKVVDNNLYISLHKKIYIIDLDECTIHPKDKKNLSFKLTDSDKGVWIYNSITKKFKGYLNNTFNINGIVFSSVVNDIDGKQLSDLNTYMCNFTYIDPEYAKSIGFDTSLTNKDDEDSEEDDDDEDDDENNIISKTSTIKNEISESEYLNQILDKINKEGLDKLTKKEKEFLDSLSKEKGGF